ncbi:MAG: hypothetical protein WCY77_10190 [Weeksellaceae bacterium]
MKIETKFNKDQEVIVIFDNEIMKGKVHAININVGFQSRARIDYDIELKIDSQTVYETFPERKVFASKEDLIGATFPVDDNN